MSTLLLLRSDKTAGSSLVVDDSPLNRAVTVATAGKPAHSTGQAKFGTTSLYFDGSASYLSVPSSPDFSFGTDSFTVDFWIYLPYASISTYDGVITTGGFQGANAWAIRLDSGGQGIQWLMGGAILSAPSIPRQQWVHVACVRSPNTISIYFNGVLQVSTANTASITSSGPVYVGTASYNLAGEDGQYYLDEVRITNAAEYTSNFTPPTSRYYISGGPVGTPLSFLGLGAFSPTGDNVTPSFLSAPALPAGLTDGDLMLAIAAHRNPASVMTASAGWTLLRVGTSMSAGAQCALRVWYKTYVTGDSAPTITFSGGTAGDTNLVTVAAVRGGYKNILFANASTFVSNQQARTNTANIPTDVNGLYIHISVGDDDLSSTSYAWNSAPSPDYGLSTVSTTLGSGAGLMITAARFPNPQDGSGTNYYVATHNHGTDSPPTTPTTVVGLFLNFMGVSGGGTVSDTFTVANGLGFATKIDVLNLTEAALVSSTATTASVAMLSESAELGDSTSFLWYPVLTDSAQLSSATFAGALRTPALLTESAVVGDSVVPSQQTAVDVTESAQLNDAVLLPNSAVDVLESALISGAALAAPALRQNVVESAVVGDRISIVRALVVNDTAVLDDATPGTRTHVTLTETALISSAAILASTNQLLVTETAALSSAATTVAQRVALQVEQAFLTDDMSDRHVLAVGGAVVNAVAWTANLGNWAMSRYTGFEFNSMTDEFAASESGLYVKGTQTVSGVFQSGRARLSKDVKSKLEYVYSDCSTPTPMDVVVSGDTPAGFATHTYTQLARDLTTSKAARAKVGRGFNSSYYSVAHRSSAEFVVHKAELVFNDTARRI